MNEDNGFYEYKVTFWDDFKGEMKSVCGVTYASTFTEAVDKIEKNYCTVENINIFGLEPYDVYEFNEEQNNFKIKEEDKNG